MSSNIGDLIWETEGTLFSVLDGLDITDVQAELVRLSADLDATKSQLTQLGGVVDNNQANTTAALLNLNTQVTNLAEQVGSYDGRITALEEADNNIEPRLIFLETEVGNLIVRADNMLQSIVVLQSRATASENRITALEAENNARLAAWFDFNKSSWTDIMMELGPMQFNVAYRLASTSSTASGLVMVYLSGNDQAVKVGKAYTGRWGATNFPYVSVSTSSQWAVRDWLVPVSQPIWVRYGASATSYVQSTGTLCIGEQ